MRCKHDKSNSWWEYDARGIPLARVCDQCKKEKLSHYKKDVLSNADYDCDEQVEPDNW